MNYDVVMSNLMANGAYNNVNVVTGKKKVSMEKLSSGYKINRAADDAAGLTISEKMRSLIKGLNQGTLNAQDGVSWVQIGDGALEEVHDMLHRMTQLSIKSLNDTNTEADRAAMQAEFDQLQSEIDRVSTTTEFNTLHIFEEHEPTYYQYEGNRVWKQDQMHKIVVPDNDSMTIYYQKTEDDPVESFEIKVPAGNYTTQELIDEIDMFLEDNGKEAEGFHLEFTGNGTCNINFEGGKVISSLEGGLQYLLHEMGPGGELGALIGTTKFGVAPLDIIAGQNNQISFTIQDEDGNETTKSITLSTGLYKKEELIDILNSELSGTGVEAVSYGSSIKLSSDDKIITEFKGNMFKIETADPIYSSVFYDNIKYADITLNAGYFIGGAVLPTDSRDIEHLKYKIDSTNNTLTFQPNESTTPTTITIPDGEYNATEMASKLNELFAANSLELKATKNPLGSSAYDGIRIDSTFVNTTSKVGIDKANSSAYATLFENREYNQFTTTSILYKANGYSYATLKADSSFSGTLPLTITAGSNDSFNLQVNGVNQTITLDANTYTTATDVVAQINSKIATTPLNDRIVAKLDGGRLMFTSIKGSDVTKINASAVAGNNGYNDAFRGKVTSDNKVSGSGKITLTDNPLPGTSTANITSPTLTVNIGGANRTANLPTGTSVTKDAIIDAINRDLAPVTVPNTFTNINATGATNNFISSGSGETRVTPDTLTGVGRTDKKQGETDPTFESWAQTNATKQAVPASLNLDSTNNKLKLTINGQTKEIEVSAGIYTRDSLKTAIQSKIDEAFGTKFGSAKVEYDSTNHMYFKAVPGELGYGKSSSISVSTADSSLLREINTTKTAGTATAKPLNSSVTLDSSNNQFTFTHNGATKTITLASGAYTSSTLINEINKQLKALGEGITASPSSDTFVLTTNDKGAGNTVSFDSSGVNDAFSTAVFKNYKTSAAGTLSKDIQASISIDDSSNKLKINGTEISLINGTYDRASFIAMVNSALRTSGIGVSASPDGNKIRFTTDAKGKDAKLNVTYADGGSAMSAIFGSSTTPGATASFDGAGNLVLTATDGRTALSVSASSGNIFLSGSTTSYTGGVTPNSKDTRYSYIDGTNLANPVEINDKNNKLKFTYKSDSTSVNYDITLDEKNYTYAELQTALQDKINEKLTGGMAGDLSVTVDASGVIIKATNPGSSYILSDFSGGFYDRVINTCTEKTSTQSTTTHNGNQANDVAYAVGRKDIRNRTTEIKKDINDTLSYDINVAGTNYNIAFTLKPGEYSGSALIDEIQDKMSKALEAKGLDPNLIKAQIGGVDTGIVGANDKNALVFMLSKDVRLPGTGRYIIDGVGGSAAFSVFYQTDGEIETAYSTGTKDLSKGVTIPDDATELTFTFDGKPVNITLDPGEYTGDEIVEAVNDKLSATGFPLGAEFDKNGSLKIYATKFGKHKIDNFDGSAKNVLFFKTNEAEGEEEDIHIQTSNRTMDYETINRQKISTCFLDINSCTISQSKYAGRALNKLEDALDQVSATRSYFGAMQNRLEHTIANNENKAENTTAAESRIRDTDMAKEMMELSTQNILEQAGISVLAQANQNPNYILSLLQ